MMILEETQLNLEESQVESSIRFHSFLKLLKIKNIGMFQKNIKECQKSTIFCRGLIYQAQFFKPCQNIAFGSKIQENLKK